MHLLSWYLHGCKYLQNLVLLAMAEKNICDCLAAWVSHTVHVYIGLLLTWLYIVRHSSRDILSLLGAVEQFAQAINYLSYVRVQKINT